LLDRKTISHQAVNTKDEMLRLYQDFCAVKEKANIYVPVWDKLSAIMDSIGK